MKRSNIVTFIFWSSVGVIAFALIALTLSTPDSAAIEFELMQQESIDRAQEEYRRSPGYFSRRADEKVQEEAARAEKSAR